MLSLLVLVLLLSFFVSSVGVGVVGLCVNGAVVNVDVRLSEKVTLPLHLIFSDPIRNS